ncbi:dual specificity tyrosine-phosphorylation-regulated kinase 4-like isoform X1 [Brachyhypopomus gauderio]|uniref:dual specificity tyrosine-phosphorylation-regulated kinase 4-like isoform X1 n=2 Tax=Brachyhypopomus gauderio TaxID=698409 RepID=UPI004042FF0B
MSCMKDSPRKFGRKMLKDLTTPEKGGNPAAGPSKQKKNAGIGCGQLPKLNSGLGAGTKLPVKPKLQPTHDAKFNKEHVGLLPPIHQGHLHGGNPAAGPSKQKKNAGIGCGQLPKLNSGLGAGTKLPVKPKLQPTHDAKFNKEHVGLLPPIHQGHLHGGNPAAGPSKQKKNAGIGCGQLPKLNSGLGAGTKLPVKPKLQPTHDAKFNKEHVGLLPPIHQGHLHEQTAGKGNEGQRSSCELRSMQENLPTQMLCNKQEHNRQFEGHQLPMTPIEVLNYFNNSLTTYEKLEIMGFSEIWYFGLNAQKIKASSKKPHNMGYDDESGTYIKVLHDHIAYRYEILGIVGEGAFGKVFKCLDHKTNEMVVVKMLSRRASFELYSNEELKILDDLRREDPNDSYNVIHMKDYFRFRNHLCISFELLGPSLYDVIKKKSEGLSEAEVRHYARELLKCLQMLKQKRIIHNDLKPENILLSQEGKGRIKVIDFGLSSYEHKRVYATAGTYPYCAPEMFLGQSYNSSFDMWSLGCTLAELFTGVQLFIGDTVSDIFACITEVLGMPPSRVLKSKAKQFVDSRKSRVRRPVSASLASFLKTKSHMFLDFIRRCLTWDPAERLTPEEALKHKWIQQGHHQSHPSAPAVRKVPANHSTNVHKRAEVAHCPGANKITPGGTSCQKPCGQGKLEPVKLPWPK